MTLFPRLLWDDTTIIYEKGSAEELPEFVKAICNYESLKKLRVKEGDLYLSGVNNKQVDYRYKEPTTVDVAAEYIVWNKS